MYVWTKLITMFKNNKIYNQNLIIKSENLSFFSLSKISEITFFTSLFIASFAFSSPSCSFSILPLSIFSDYRNISIVLSTSYLEISYFSSSSLKASSRKFLSFIVSCSFFTFWVSFSAIRFLRSAIFGKSFCLRKLLSKMFWTMLVIGLPTSSYRDILFLTNSFWSIASFSIVEIIVFLSSFCCDSICCYSMTFP